MHVIHLGLAYTANGSTLCRPQSVATVSSEVQCLQSVPRMMLVESGHYGRGSLSAQFDRAYDGFKAFLRSRRVYCSQPPFRPGLAFCQQT